MKKLLWVTACIFSTTLMVACGSKSKEKDDGVFKPALDTNTECQIKVVGDYSNFEALEAEFDRFNEYYPNVELSYVKLDDYVNTLGTSLASDDKPNIFFSYASWMAGDAKYDNIISHMEVLSDSNLKLKLDCIRPGLVNHDANNNVLMVPVFSRTYGMLVNNDLFQKEGVKVPTTWGELLTACSSFAEKEYKNPMMGFMKKSSNCLMQTIAYPSFVASLAKSQEAITKANNLDAEAGVYMREALEKVDYLIDNGAIDLEECDKIENDYNSVIKTFFYGDVPMMISTGDAASGTKKREIDENYPYISLETKFNYSYIPIPLTDKGGYFIDSPSVQFSVNKDCKNLDMTNEFMRFLVTKAELNNMASLKRLVTPTTETSFDPFYASFAQVPTERTFSPEALGIKDPAFKQIREASYKVGKGELTVEKAIEMYGSF